MEMLSAEGLPFDLGDAVADSGEATLYSLPDDPGYLLKVYHEIDPARAAKLAAMIEAPPRDPSLSPFHRAFAWPQEGAYDAEGCLVGVVIPEVPNARTLSALASPKLRRTRAPEIDGYHLHAIGANLAFLVSLLHEQGVVIGDIKPENVLVDDRALVTLVDCDSVQFPSTRLGDVHLCRLGSDGLTPPEWIGRDFTEVPRDETADRFGLAVLLHQLLLGAHPWNGTWTGAGEPPPRDTLIAEGQWPRRPGAKLAPTPGTASIDALSPNLRDLFTRCFLNGHETPSERPSAAEWHEALCHAMADLRVCDGDARHYKHPGKAPCPWCVLEEETGVALFPRAPEDRDPFAPLTLAFERALARGDARMAHELWSENRCLREHPALARHGERMAAMTAGYKAFDAWADLYKRTKDDPARIIEAWESEPALGRELALLDEEIDGIPALTLITRLRDQALEIPTPPPESQVSPEALPQPMKVGTGPAEIRYRVVPGWYGLRPARIRFDVARKVFLPAMEILDSSSGLPLGRIDAQTLQGRTEVAFDQPAWRAHIMLRPCDPEKATHFALIAPPAREATIGAPASKPRKLNRPRRLGNPLHA